ncbi:MAG: hypothetical protein ABEI31_10390 [Halodesulfurarchaeum sp.]
MLLTIAYSSSARQSLRNTCNANEEAVVRRFGRAVLFEETRLGALLALRLREKHGADVQIERTEPLNEFRDVPAAVRAAAAAYEDRENPSTSYAKFAAGTDHPTVEELADVEL